MKSSNRRISASGKRASGGPNRPWIGGESDDKFQSMKAAVNTEEMKNKESESSIMREEMPCNDLRQSCLFRDFPGNRDSIFFKAYSVMFVLLFTRSQVMANILFYFTVFFLLLGAFLLSLIHI